MRSILVLLAGLVACSASAGSSLFRASAALDAQDVVPLFAQLDKDLQLGLSAHQLARKTRITSPDIAWNTEFEVRFNGSSAKLRYSVRMHDNFAPSITFASSSGELIDAIQSEIERYLREVGKWPGI